MSLALLKTAFSNETPVDWGAVANDESAPNAPSVTHTTAADGIAVLVSFADVEATALEWLWPGRIPLGTLTIFDGDPGKGKSLITADLAARVSTGAAMPDGTRSDLVGPENVVMVFCEDDAAATVRPRLDAACADVARVFELHGSAKPDASGVRPFTLADVATLRAALEQSGARLVTVDPWAAYLGGKDSHRDEKMREILTPLAALAHEFSVAIVIVRHITKAGGSAVTGGAGSMGITGAARSVLLVAEDPENPDLRVIAVSKGNLSARAPSLSFGVESVEMRLPDSKGELKPVQVPFLNWLGESESSADDLIAASRADAKTKGAASDVETWLLETLDGEPREAEELQRAALKSGHTKSTYERARAKLNKASKIWKRKDAGVCGSWWWGAGAEPSAEWLGERSGWAALARK